MQRAHAVNDNAKHVLDRNGEVDQFDHFRLRVADRGFRRRECVELGMMITASAHPRFQLRDKPCVAIVGVGDRAMTSSSCAISTSMARSSSESSSQSNCAAASSSCSFVSSSVDARYAAEKTTDATGQPIDVGLLVIARLLGDRELRGEASSFLTSFDKTARYPFELALVTSCTRKLVVDRHSYDGMPITISPQCLFV